MMKTGVHLYLSGMSTESNKAAVRQFYEDVFTRVNVDLTYHLIEVVWPQVRSTSPSQQFGQRARQLSSLHRK